MDIGLPVGFVAKVNFSKRMNSNKLVLSSGSIHANLSTTQFSEKKIKLSSNTENLNNKELWRRFINTVFDKRLDSEIINRGENLIPSDTCHQIKEEVMDFSFHDQSLHYPDIKPEPSPPLCIGSHDSLQHDHNYAEKSQSESNPESIHPVFLFQHSGVSPYITGEESRLLQQTESTNNNTGPVYELHDYIMGEESSIFQCNMLKRKRAGDAGENGYRCLISDCKQKYGIQRPSFTSYRNWHDHMVSKHGDGYPDPQNEGKQLINSHAFGESILAIQNNIACKVDGCDEPPFSSFKKLGMHLKTQHTDVLDCQPFNSTWKLGVSKAEDDHFLSQLNNDHYLGKRYQTRHGNGFLCSSHLYYPVRQTPEGLCDYWLDNHVGFRSLCPIRSCTSERGERLGFRDYKELYQHMKNQHPEPLNNEALDFSPFTSAILSSFQALPLLVITNP